MTNEEAEAGTLICMKHDIIEGYYFTITPSFR